MAFFINDTADSNGWYGNPTCEQKPNKRELPESLLPKYLEYKGFVTLSPANGKINSVSKNTSAYNKYASAHPDHGAAQTIEERVEAIETSGVLQRVDAIEAALGDTTAAGLSDMQMALQQALGAGGVVDVHERIIALEDTVNNLPSDSSGLGDRVEALEEAVQSLPGSDSGLSGRVDALEDSVSALTDTVNGLPTGGGESGGDAETVYNEMAAAYREGVQSA